MNIPREAKKKKKMGSKNSRVIISRKKRKGEDGQEKCKGEMRSKNSRGKNWDKTGFIKPGIKTQTGFLLGSFAPTIDE